MEQEFPRFSDREMGRRWRAADELLKTHDLDLVVAYGANRSGSAVQWFSGWQVTREAFLLLGSGGEQVMFVQYYNHVPAARRVVFDCEVRWGGESTAVTVAGELSRRNADRIGVIGPLPYKAHSMLDAAVGTIVDLDHEYTSLRLTKSPEELDWLRHGSELTDRAVRALADGVRPGIDERELGAITEGAYLAEGGTNQIHYFAVTSMSEPDMCVPSQWPSTRRVQSGDVLTTEISVNWWGYSGQVLRTMTIDADPTDQYRDLHAVADAAYEAILEICRDGTPVSEIVSVASEIIDDAGYTIYDDLVHGYGGGYLPPVLGIRSRANEPTPDMTLSSGMTIVIQPNVITADETMGVQTGGLIAVTEDAPEELHQVPRGLWQVGSR